MFGKSKLLVPYALPESQEEEEEPETNRRRRLPNTKHYGIVTRWLLGRGFGFVTADDLDHDVLVHYASFGGGNLVVGKYIHFELDPNMDGKKAKYAENVTGEAVNKLWMDVDGNIVDWSVSYPREFYRLKLLDKCDASKRLRWHKLDTRFLTHATSDDEYKQMIANQLAEVKSESIVDMQEEAENQARERQKQREAEANANPSRSSNGGQNQRPERRESQRSDRRESQRSDRDRRGGRRSSRSRSRERRSRRY
eukprot:TRINITY_DN15924_c0_g1_i1.p1 TRINITY_DN15924_c0_g1~~TRINITY_DN15924_c0_g1_i1.p1  ORF type:complete len:264 (+),score=44.33 TRINITY_DN15924_c0_g1_i1:35-793(+)